MLCPDCKFIIFPFTFLASLKITTTTTTTTRWAVNRNEHVPIEIISCQIASQAIHLIHSK